MLHQESPFANREVAAAARSKERAKGKAKQKKKTSARTEEHTPVVEGGRGVASSLCCHVCQGKFKSRNRLFQHIKDSGHALKLDGASISAQSLTVQSRKKRK